MGNREGKEAMRRRRSDNANVPRSGATAPNFLAAPAGGCDRAPLAGEGPLPHAESACLRVAAICGPVGRIVAAVALVWFCATGLWAQRRPEDFSRLLPPVAGIHVPVEGASAVNRALQQKHYGEAEQLLYAEIQKNPASAVLLQRIADVFFLDHRFLNCAIALKKAEALDPLDERHRFLLAMSYVLMGYEDWARPELQALAAQNPKQPLYPYWLARLEFSRRRYLQALQKVQQALKVDAGYANAWDLQGLCNYALGRYDEAVVSYQKAVAANRRKARSPWPPLDFGSLLVKMGRLDEAGKALREAVRLGPNLAQAHEELGLLLEQQKDLHGAETELQIAARLAPADPGPHYGLARIYRNRGEAARAARESALFGKLKKARDNAEMASPQPPRSGH